MGHSFFRGSLTRTKRLSLAATALAAVAAVACSSGGYTQSDDTRLAADLNAPVVTATPLVIDEQRSLLESLEQYPSFKDEESGFGVILGTPDLGVGQNRVAFVMTDSDFGIVKFPFSRVETFFLPDGPGGKKEGPVERVNAQFFDFPLRVRGIYVANLNLDRAGTWEIFVTIPDNDGNRIGIRFPFDVADASASVALGERVPPSANRTLSDVDSIFELTTAGKPDPLLYDRSIKSLVDEGRPFVVTFASPAFCTNALCGPQVEVLSSVGERHSDIAEFVHIDLYENPDEIKGDLSRADRTPILEEWGVHTDEWTFVVNGNGEVVAKFEAFVPEEELEQAVVRFLEQPG
ncbi:MAG: thioredoxin family protein [Chloroflexi bacterium]|nr:thioredoxin family protein [Chloroflexota bacterium]